MQNLVCRHISSRLLNESERSVEFLSWLQVSTSIKTIFTLGIESNREDSLWLFAALQDSVTVSDEVLWDMSKCSVMSTRIADWRSSSCISGFLYLEEDDSVIVSLASGEIFRISRLVNHHSSNDARFVPLQEFGQVETIGIFPQGVHCMQLSPDGEILCLLTGTSPTQVVFMAAEDWTILSQQDLGSLEDTRESLQLKSSSSNVPPSEWNIAWRSDGALVSITYPLNGSSNKIQMQVFRRERFTLESSCEHIWESNSCCIDWQPRVGGSIAVNLSNESIIRFYETNGLALRRLYLDAEIYCKQLQWSEQYSILVCGNSSHIRIFYHSNYHWYLKQEWIFSEFGEIAAFRIVQDRVVADRNFLYVLTTHGKLFCFMFQWQFDVFKSGEDECYLAAIDGNEIAITYLSRQIIPAPLCSFVLVCSCCIQRLEMDNKGGCLVLLSNGAMEYFSYSIIKKATCESHRVTCTKGRQLENNLDHIFKENKRETCHAGYLLPIHIEQKRELVWKAFAVSPERSSHDDMSLRILVIGERLRMYAFSLEQDKWDCDLEFLKDYAKEESIWLDMQLMTMPKGDFDSQRLVICCSENYITFRDIEKLFDESEHWKVSLQTLGLTYHQILHLKSTNVMKLESNSRTECHYIVMFFLDTQGRLWTTIQPISASHSLNSACHFLLLSEDCVDFEVVTEFLFFTTRFHKLYTFPIDFILDSFLENISGTEVYRKIEWNENKLDCRPIDRFSRIVTFVTDRTAKRNNCLILQAPRGNLESVVPRLVIQRIVEQHIHNAAYGEAYSLCRRHRLPVDILVEKNPEKFKENLLDFIRHFKDPEHLNTFVSMLGSEKEDTIRNEWCDMFIKGLRQLLDEPKYRYPLICAFLQKRPRDISGALQVLQLDKKDSAAPEYSSDASLAEDLMDFLLLLVKDSVLVFREALGLYDLSLAALVVERASDLDPAYYGALLQRLNDSCPEKRKYLVDLELGNMESALRHLFAFSTFPSAGDMVIDFAVEHRLFPLACSLFAEYPELLTRIRCAYADDLSQQGQHLEAACFYALIKQEESAREEYKRACMWQLVVYFCRIQQWKHLSSSDKVEKVSTQVSQDGLRIDQELVREIESLVEYLKLNGKAKEAAFLIVDYLNDPQRAIEELIAIEEWLDAISVLGRVPLKEFWGVVETTWKPALKNAAQEHCEEWKEIANKMGYYCQRLEQVRLEKKNKSETKNDAVLDVYVEEEMLSESDASSQSVSSWGEWTMSSDTSKASLYSLLSKKDQKRKGKKKKSKKIKPGDPREEEYLVGYLSKMIPSSSQWDILNQLLHCMIAVCMEKEARKLYQVMKHFVSVVQTLPEDIIGRDDFMEHCFQKWKCLE